MSQLQLVNVKEDSYVEHLAKFPEIIYDMNEGNDPELPQFASVGLQKFAEHAFKQKRVPLNELFQSMNAVYDSVDLN